MMRKLMVGVLMAATCAFGQWVPVSVNTTTWECKPYYDRGDGTLGTNFWNNLGNGNTSAVPIIPTSPPTAVVTNLIPSYYSDVTTWYSFSQSSGNQYVYDDSGNTNRGVFYPSATPSRWPEQTSYALKFTDTDQSVMLSEVSGLSPSLAEFTVSLWVKPTASFDDYYTLIVNGNASWAINNIWCGGGGFGSPYTFNVLTVGNSGYYCAADWGGPFNASTSRWTHVVFTYEKTGAEAVAGATLNLYTNGVLVSGASPDYNFLITLTNRWALGGFFSSGESSDPSITRMLWSGYYDDVVIDDHYWDLARVTNVYANYRSLAMTNYAPDNLSATLISGTNYAITADLSSNTVAHVYLFSGLTNGYNWLRTQDLGIIAPERGDVVSNNMYLVSGVANYYAFLSSNAYYSVTSSVSTITP